MQGNRCGPEVQFRRRQLIAFHEAHAPCAGFAYADWFQRRELLWESAEIPRRKCAGAGARIEAKK